MIIISRFLKAFFSLTELAKVRSFNILSVLGFNTQQLAANCHSGEPRIRACPGLDPGSGAGAGIQKPNWMPDPSSRTRSGTGMTLTLDTLLIAAG